MELRSKKWPVSLQCHRRNEAQKFKSSHDGQSVALDNYLNINYLLFWKCLHLLAVGQAVVRPVLRPEFLPLYPIFTSYKLRMTLSNPL